MSLEVELIEGFYGRRWQIHITINTPSLGELAKTDIYIDEPYNVSLEDWRKITGGDCAMSLHGFSLDDGYYQFWPACDYGTNFYTRIKEEVLRDKLSAIIDKAVELKRRFADES